MTRKNRTREEWRLVRTWRRDLALLILSAAIAIGAAFLAESV